MYTIYKITDIKTGKIYVGQTKHSLHDRLSAHASSKNSPLYIPIRKYGMDNFKIEPIDSADSLDQALNKESYWIQRYNCLDPDIGYNRMVTSSSYKRLMHRLGEDELKSTKTYNVEPLRSFSDIEDMKEALYELGGARDRFLFTLGINTGLRVSDLVTLTVGQIRNRSYADILEKKTGKKRRIHLLALQPDIIEYTEGMGDDEYLFPSRNGGHISTTQAYRILVRAGDWIGRKDIGTHTMRKTFGYHYYRKTLDIATLMEIFGHSAPSITKRYIGIRDDEIADSLRDFRL